MPRPSEVGSGLLVPNLYFEALLGKIEVPMFPSYFAAFPLFHYISFSPVSLPSLLENFSILTRQFFTNIPLFAARKCHLSLVLITFERASILLAILFPKFHGGCLLVKVVDPQVSLPLTLELNAIQTLQHVWLKPIYVVRLDTPSFHFHCQ